MKMIFGFLISMFLLPLSYAQDDKWEVIGTKGFSGNATVIISGVK
jgi:hypothetical protein